MQTDKQTVFWRRTALIAALLTAALLWIALDVWLGFTEPDGRTVTIPDCTGRAVSELTPDACFDVTVEYRYDEQAPRGTVIAQSPAAGVQRKLAPTAPTCALKLTVSLGRERILLSDEVGANVREAAARLREQGLRVKTVTVTGNAPEGRVLDMQPAAGTELFRGDAVTLTVSVGMPVPTVKVPDLTGLSRSDALVQIWLSQLSVGDVVEVFADAPVGTVVRQSHLAGTVVRAGTRITLYISMQE